MKNTDENMKWKCPYCNAENDASGIRADLVELAECGDQDEILMCSRCHNKCDVTFEPTNIDIDLRVSDVEGD